MNKVRIFITILLLFTVLIPVGALYAQGSETDPPEESTLQPGWSNPRTGLVPCDGVTVKCDFCAFIKLANNVITFIIYTSFLVAVVGFMYAGLLLLTAQGDPGKRNNAKKIFTHTMWGFVIILSAWLIVYTIGNVFLDVSFSFIGGPNTLQCPK